MAARRSPTAHRRRVQAATTARRRRHRQRCARRLRRRQHRDGQQPVRRPDRVRQRGRPGDRCDASRRQRRRRRRRSHHRWTIGRRPWPSGCSLARPRRPPPPTTRPPPRTVLQDIPYVRGRRVGDARRQAGARRSRHSRPSPRCRGARRGSLQQLQLAKTQVPHHARRRHPTGHQRHGHPRRSTRPCSTRCSDVRTRSS